MRNIIVIGASAGGIQALKTFFENVPANSNAAYVVILHLSPDHDSKLAEVLQAVSAIPVTQVKEKVRVQADHVYVVPPNESLSIQDGHIIVSPVLTIEERRAPVDIFFRTLAESHEARSVAVILSGTGANGSMGIKRVKEKGGAAFVQNPREAEFGEMPRNSIATELVDEILNVAEIPAKIIAYGKNLGKIVIPVEPEEREERQQAALRDIFTNLRVRTGHDFANYKRPTVLRRIERRINVRGLPDLPEYAAYLKETPEETHALLKDLLISVTNFFRDKEAFNFLEQQIVPRILHDKTSKDQIRLWIAGCATGEEAYSLAMLLAEQTSHAIDPPSIQIFATDIDEDAIAAARNGFYTLNDATDVSPERLRRFFNTEKDGFRVRRELREMILFANHNLLKDPPFSRLDLATCRNLLIYFNGTAQERVLETLHFSLKPNGFLFLGSSESIDGAGDLYAPMNRELRVFQARQTQPRIAYPVPDLSPSLRFDQSPTIYKTPKNEKNSFDKTSYGDLHGRILEQFAPPSIIVNELFDIVHVSERAGRFLQISGELTKNLFKLIRPELRLDVSTAVYQAVQNQTNVRAENLTFHTGEGGGETINVSVRPVLREDEDATYGFILIVFEPAENAPNDAETVFSSPEPVNRQLEDALLHSQSQYRYSIEQSEVQAEELKASNEELQAINEELRSATEELETGKEELQSVNEELITVNQELKIKIEELSNTNNDLKNLINSTSIGTIFLDRNFRVKMFTPVAGEIFNLIPADNGRLLSDITHKLEDEHLVADVEAVLQKLQPVEREVRTTDGNYYLMQITPYRTADDRINGTIITFVNIKQRVEAEQALQKSARNLELQSRIFDTTLSSINDFAYTFDRDGRFTYSNKPLLDLLGITLEEIVGKNFFDLNYPQDLAARLQRQIQEVFDTKKLVKDETPFTSPSGADGFFEYIFNPVLTPNGEVELVAGSTRDITERKRIEAALGFLADFSQTLLHLATEQEIVESFGEKINFLTGANVCAFFEISEPKDEAEITAEWHEAGDFSLSGKFSIPELVSDEFQKAMTEGETIVVRDISEDSHAKGKEQLASFGIGSFVNVPLIRGGEWKFVLGVYHAGKYDWRDDEINLLIESANRIWTKLERLRAQKELQESEERLRALIKNLPGGAVFIVDRDLRYQLADGEALYDLKSEDFVGKTIFEALPPDLAANYKDYYRKALAGESFTHEHFAHGAAFLTHGTPLLEENGEVYAVLAVSYDISDRKQTEDKLRESEEWMSLILKSVEDYAIITTDENGIINGWNPGAEKAFGYTEQEIIGKSTDIIFTPEDREKNIPVKEMQKALETDRAEDERWHLRKDGSRFYVSGVMQPIKDGKVDGYVKVARDMTERLKVQQIERDKEMLQKLVGAQEDERRRIARDLHDELGQLLTALRLQLEAVRKLCEEDKLCGKIDETQLLAKKVNEGIDFLAWELRPAALDDFGLYPALVKYVREWSHYSGVTAELLDSSIEKARFTHEVETNLYRIAQEALNNVHKHADAKRIEVSFDKRGKDLIVLIIEDDGRGFDLEDKLNQDKGIGLIGIKERTALIGGSLEIESVPGRGTTIFVRVPAELRKKENLDDE